MKREYVEYVWAHADEPLAIATILGTRGSTPRKMGTTMVVHADGRIKGTIGGGRAEHEIVQEALSVLQEKEAFRRIHINLNDEVAVREGMVCGGTMDVWIEGVHP